MQPSPKQLIDDLKSLVDRSPRAIEDAAHALCTAIGKDKRFELFAAPKVVGTVERVLKDGVTDIKAAVESVHGHLSAAEKIDPSFFTGTKDIVRTERMMMSGSKLVDRWHGLDHAEKLNTGMSLLAAGLSALGAWSCAKQAVQTDETGNHHLNASMAGLAILQAAFTVGIAYVGVQALRGGAAR